MKSLKLEKISENSLSFEKQPETVCEKIIFVKKYFNANKIIYDFYKPLFLLLFCILYGIENFAQNGNFTYSDYLKNEEKKREIGRLTFREKNYIKAIELSNEIICSKYDCKDINYDLAKCYLYLGDSLKSKKYFLKAIKQGYYTQHTTLFKDTLIYKNFQMSPVEFLEAEQDFIKSINMNVRKDVGYFLYHNLKTQQEPIIDSLIKIYGWVGEDLIGFDIPCNPDIPNSYLNLILSSMNDSIILQKYYSLIENACFQQKENWNFLEQLLISKMFLKFHSHNYYYIPLNYLFLNEKGEIDFERSFPEIKALIYVAKKQKALIQLYCSEKMNEKYRAETLEKIRQIFANENYGYAIKISDKTINEDGFLFFNYEVFENIIQDE